MAPIENPLVIERPVEEVWDFFMDWSNIESWYGGLRVTQVNEGPPGLGTEVQLCPPLGPQKVPTPPLQIVEFEPLRRIVFNGTGVMLKSAPTRFIFESLGPTSMRFTKLQD